MDQATILALVRHILTAGGAVLVTDGVISDSQLQTVIGAVIAIAPVVWAIVQKRQQTAAVIAAAASGVAKQATVLSPIAASKTPAP